MKARVPGQTMRNRGLEEENGSRLKEFWSDNLIFGGATLLAGLFNYLYHVVLAHHLGPGTYGDLMTFLNVTWLLVLPAPVVTLIYTRLGKRPAHAVTESVWLWGGGIFLWLMTLPFDQSLSRLLHINPLLLAVFNFEVVPSLALAANQGMLQRARRYVWVGILAVLNNGFRVAAAAGTNFSGYRLFALGLMEIAGVWVAWGASRWFVNKMGQVGEPVSASLITGTAVAGVLTAISSLADGLFAKHSLGATLAGQYNGLATLGHSIQFIAGSLGTVMLTSMLANPAQRNRYLVLTLAVYGGLAGAMLLIFASATSWVVVLVLGRKFLDVAPYLFPYGMGMVALGFLNLAMMYSVARKRWEPIMAVALGVVYWLWQLLRARTFGEFVHATFSVMGSTLGVTCCVMAAIAWLASNRGRISVR